jgi:hypothetical protein
MVIEAASDNGGGDNNKAMQGALVKAVIAVVV